MPRISGSHLKERLKPGTRQRAWTAMRIHKVFTTFQIRAVSGISENALNSYLRDLGRAGYVKIQRPRQKGKSMGHAVWRLVRDTGPRQPIVRTDGTGVYDPNQDRVYPYSQDDNNDGRTGRVAHGAS